MFHFRCSAANAAISALIAVCGLPCVAMAAPTIVVDEQFEGAALPTGWRIGSQAGGTVLVSADTSSNFGGSRGSLRGAYPVATGSVYVWTGYIVSALQTSELFIEFWAKAPSPVKQGLKFLKVFGGNAGGVSSSNYANVTFALDYTGIDLGAMYQVSFGDGSTIGNDTQQVVNFDGSSPQLIGRSYGRATVKTPQGRRFASSDWGTAWHHFRIRVKFNSGTSLETEVADGAFYVEIDGKVYVDATGLFNRHYSNAPIDRVELFGWSQNGTTPFEVWYDSVRISTGGFVDSKGVPKPPLDVVVN